MTDEKKQPIEFYKARPDEYSIASNGAVRETATGRIITIFPELNPHTITSQSVYELHRLYRAKRVKAVVKGRVMAARKFLEGKKLPVEIADPATLTDEELIQAGGDAETLTSYLYHLAFYKAADKAAAGDGGNFRAIVEGYSKAFESFTEEPKAPPSEQPGQISGSPQALAELVTLLEHERDAVREKARAIEGTIK